MRSHQGPPLKGCLPINRQTELYHSFGIFRPAPIFHGLFGKSEHTPQRVSDAENDVAARRVELEKPTLRVSEDYFSEGDGQREFRWLGNFACGWPYRHPMAKLLAPNQEEMLII